MKEWMTSSDLFQLRVHFTSTELYIISTIYRSKFRRSEYLHLGIAQDPKNVKG